MKTKRYMDSAMTYEQAIHAYAGVYQATHSAVALINSNIDNYEKEYLLSLIINKLGIDFPPINVQALRNGVADFMKYGGAKSFFHDVWNSELHGVYESIIDSWCEFEDSGIDDLRLYAINKVGDE